MGGPRPKLDGTIGGHFESAKGVHRWPLGGGTMKVNRCFDYK